MGLKSWSLAWRLMLLSFFFQPKQLGFPAGSAKEGTIRRNPGGRKEMRFGLLTSLRLDHEKRCMAHLLFWLESRF